MDNCEPTMPSSNGCQHSVASLSAIPSPDASSFSGGGPPHLATLAVGPRPCPHRSGKRASSPHSMSRRASSVLVPTAQREPSPLRGSRRQNTRRRSGLSSGRNLRMACTGGLGRPHSAPPTCPQRCGIAQQASWLFGIWDLSRHEPQAGAKLGTGWNKSVVPAFLKNCST